MNDTRIEVLPLSQYNSLTDIIIVYVGVGKMPVEPANRHLKRTKDYMDHLFKARGFDALYLPTRGETHISCVSGDSDDELEAIKASLEEFNEQTRACVEDQAKSDAEDAIKFAFELMQFGFGYEEALSAYQRNISLEELATEMAERNRAEKDYAERNVLQLGKSLQDEMVKDEKYVEVNFPQDPEAGDQYWEGQFGYIFNGCKWLLCENIESESTKQLKYKYEQKQKPEITFSDNF